MIVRSENIFSAELLRNSFVSMNQISMNRIRLSRESFDFAVTEGTEIFKNSRSLNFQDTVQTKINNCLVGAFGQQVFIEATKGHRVTKEECPQFAYDVLTTNGSLRNYCGWSDDRDASSPARVEVKVMSMEGRKWISFNDRMFKHVTRCAGSGMLDYVVFYGIQNINLDIQWNTSSETIIPESNCVADIGLLGVISAKVLTMPDLRRPSVYTKGESFLNKNQIHQKNLGVIFL